jgi:hypothetical protein
MKPELRQTSIQSLSPRLRAALEFFMKSCKASSLNHTKRNVDDMESIRTPAGNPTKSGHQIGLLTTKKLETPSCHQKPTYKAQMHIKALRFYATGQANLEVALDRQMILMQLRQALLAASTGNPCLWEDAHATHQICIEVLHANNTSEIDMGLSSYVYLRAGHLLIQNCTIISPVMPLIETLDLHCRLLRARRTSWQALRAEWVELMQSSMQPLARRRTLAEAEAVADGARADALKIQFTRSERRLAKAMELDERWASKQHRTMAQKLRKEQWKLASARKAALASRRQLEKEREEKFNLRQKWFKRSDLTMDDIMRGPPLRYS